MSVGTKASRISSGDYMAIKQVLDVEVMPPIKREYPDPKLADWAEVKRMLLLKEPLGLPPPPLG